MKRIAFVLFACAFMAAPTRADLTDYSIFGVNGVDIGNYLQIKGLVGSGGNVSVGNSGTVFDGARAGGDFSAGNYFSTPAGIDVVANGNISVGNSATVGGSLIAGGTVTYGNFFSGTTVEGASTPYSPIPTLPGPTSFTAGGGNVGDGTLIPGTYGTLSTGNYDTVTLSHGTYYFDAIALGNNCVVNLDVTGGDILIYSVGNISFGNFLDFNVTGGSARDIYIETHGNFNIGASGELFGTVFAPGGSVILGQSDIDAGNYLDLHGAFYSDNVVNLGNSNEINLTEFEVSDHFAQMVNPVPVPGAVLLGMLGLSAAGVKLRRKRS